MEEEAYSKNEYTNTWDSFRIDTYIIHVNTEVLVPVESFF
jgi:hypothetical protein